MALAQLTSELTPRRSNEAAERQKRDVFRLLGESCGIVAKRDKTVHMARINRCSSYVEKGEHGSSAYVLPYPVLGTEQIAIIKETFYSTEGIPRLVSIDHRYAPHATTTFSINIGLRGTGHLSWITVSEGEVIAIGHVPLSIMEVQQIIAAERGYFQDFYRYSIARNGNARFDLFECGFDRRDYMFTVIRATHDPSDGAFQKTIAQTRKLFPHRMLVVPSYPFSVPIELAKTCDRKVRCAMCTLEEVGGKIPTISEIKSHIDEWASSIGWLTASTQSVFLGRNNLFGLPFGLLMEALAYLKSASVVDAITQNLRPRLKDDVHKKVELWGSIGRLSAFASVRHVLGLSHEELQDLGANGLTFVTLSLETGSNEIRSQLGKNYSTSEVIEATKRLLDAGIRVNMIILLGIADSRHIAETTLAIESLAGLNTSKYDPEIRILLSPIDLQFASPRLAEHANPDRVLTELNAIGTPVTSIGRSRVMFDAHSGLELALHNGKRISVFPYNYGALFV